MNVKAVYIYMILGCACVILVYLLTPINNLLFTRVEESPCPLSQNGSFASHDIPSTALVSFPGSGNTWARHLFTTASGVLTAAIYHEPNSVNINKRNKEKARRVIAVKTHLGPQGTHGYFPFERCILLIRSPYEALLAEYNRQAGRFPGHGFIRQPTKFNRDRGSSPRLVDIFQDWPGFVSKRKGGWSSLYLGWLTKCGPPNLHVLVYSRMMHDLQHELHALFRFLNDSSITPMVHCAVRNREGTAHRKEHTWQEKVAVFSENQTQFLNAAIDKVQAALEAATGQSFEDFQDWKR